MASRLGFLTKSIKGSVTLITGAKSGDLGSATLNYFLRKGGKCMVYDIPEAYRQKPINSENCVFAIGDIRDEEKVENAMKLCKEHFGRLDNVINCAGIHRAERIYAFKHKRPHSYSNIQLLLDVNVTGRFNIIRQAVRLMKENEPDEDGQRGVIVNVAGSAAFCGMGGQSAIAACEGALVSMTLPLSRDLAEVGIRVVTVAPGQMDTAIVDKYKTPTKGFFLTVHEFPRRFGDPIEFAELCKHVCENPLINGEVICLDAAARYPF